MISDKRPTRQAIAEWLGISPAFYTTILQRQKFPGRHKLRQFKRLTGIPYEDWFELHGPTLHADLVEIYLVKKRYEAANA